MGTTRHTQQGFLWEGQPDTGTGLGGVEDLSDLDQPDQTCKVNFSGSCVTGRGVGAALAIHPSPLSEQHLGKQTQTWQGNTCVLLVLP